MGLLHRQQLLFALVSARQQYNPAPCCAIAAPQHGCAEVPQQAFTPLDHVGAVTRRAGVLTPGGQIRHWAMQLHVAGGVKVTSLHDQVQLAEAAPFPACVESVLCSSSCAGAESARAAAAGAESQWQGAIAQGSTQFVLGFTNPPRPSAGVEDVQAAAAGASLPWQAPTALRAHTVHARAKVASHFPDAGAEGVRVAAAGAGPSWQAPRARRR